MIEGFYINKDPDKYNNRVKTICVTSRETYFYPISRKFTVGMSSVESVHREAAFLCVGPKEMVAWE